MNKNALTILIVCLSVFGLSSSGLSYPGGVNWLIEFKGNVQIKRIKWHDFHKAHKEHPLSHEDQIKLNATASATIFCSNTDKKPVKPGKVSRVSEVCSSGTPTKDREGIYRGKTRSPNETIPYIISPRNTALLNNHPILRWNAVPGATRYRVRVKDASLKLDWQTETNKTQIEYPADKPPLQPGSNYSLIVETEQEKSSDKEEGIDLSFTVLDAQKSELVRTEIAKIKQLKLTQNTEELLLADLYQSYDLKAEAIELLEGLVKRGSQSVAVYQLLGNLYLQVGLSQQATNPYLQALELAEKTKDIEGQANAQEGLGEAYYGLNNKKEGIMWLKKSKDNYTILGDKLKVEELEKRINS